MLSTLLVRFLPILKEVTKISNNNIAYKVKSNLYYLFIGTIFKYISSILPRRFKANIIYSS
jgi:hypothetical protein